MQSLKKCHISPREKQVVNLLAEGLTSKEISTGLRISTHTVESHKRNLIERLNVRNTTHMVARAIRTGIL